MSLYVTKGFLESQITLEIILVKPLLFLYDYSVHWRDWVTDPGTYGSNNKVRTGTQRSQFPMYFGPLGKNSSSLSSLSSPLTFSALFCFPVAWVFLPKGNLHQRRKTQLAPWISLMETGKHMTCRHVLDQCWALPSLAFTDAYSASDSREKSMSNGNLFILGHVARPLVIHYLFSVWEGELGSKIE